MNNMLTACDEDWWGHASKRLQHAVGEDAPSTRYTLHDTRCFIRKR